MKNKLLKRFLPLLLVILFIVPAYGSGLNIKVDGVLENLEFDTTIVNGTTMIDAKQIPKIIESKVFDINTKTTRIKNDKHIMDLTVDNKMFELDGNKLQLPEAPIKIDNKMYVPLRNIVKHLGAKVSWENKTRTIVIDTGKKEVSILNSQAEITEKTRVLTYKAGLELAINDSVALKNLEDSKKILDENIIDLKDSPYYTAEKTGLSADQIKLQRNVRQLEMQLKNIYENRIILKGSIEFSYRNYLNNIKTYEFNKKQLEESVALEKINYQNTNLKYELGMESKVNLDIAKEKLKKNETDFANINISLKNEKEALNLLIGHSAPEDVYIEYTPEFKTIEDNVERYIAVKNIDDPKIVVAKREIEYYRYVKDSTTNDMDESKLELDNNIKKSERAYSDIMTSYAKNLYSNYNNIKQLEQKQKSLEIDLNLARTSYNVTVTNYEAGNMTKYDVQSAKVNLLNVETEIEKNKLSFNNLILLYENPYLQ